MKYLLDTNVIIDFLSGVPEVVSHLREATLQECCMTGITLYELYYGAYLSSSGEKAVKQIDSLASAISILSEGNYMKEAASQKARLKAEGNLIEDFDIIIGAAAKVNGLTLVTNNTKHMAHLHGVSMVNWRM